jgi:hypothetical protein
MIGCGTRAPEVVRRGMMRGWCVPCCVADGRVHTAVYRLSERACRVRAGVAGRGRGDQPGGGGLCKLDSTALVRCGGRIPRGSGGGFEHACAAGLVLELCTVECLWQEVVQPMFHLIRWGHLDNRVRHACD